MPTPRSIYDPNAYTNALGRLPKEESIRIEDQVVTEGETTQAEEPEEAIHERLIRSQDQIGLILMVLHYRNRASDEEKLRQIRIIVE